MARKKIVLSFSVTGDYKQSWDYIEKGLNSVNRYTNLCICIESESEMSSR